MHVTDKYCSRMLGQDCIIAQNMLDELGCYTTKPSGGMLRLLDLDGFKGEKLGRTTRRWSEQA